MRLSLLFLLAFVLNPAGHAHAATVKIRFGEKALNFQLVDASTNTPPRLVYFTDSGPPVAKDLSVENFNYLRSMILEIKGPFSNSSKCPRSSIDVHIGKRELFGCLNGKSKSDLALKNLADFLNFIN